jgi:hypothetical protein
MAKPNRRRKRNIFKTTPTGRIPRSRFNMECSHKSTFKLGWLVPCLVEETLPGDTWLLSNEVVMRFLPLYWPMMHNIEVTFHYFYAPKRILWSGDLELNKGFQDHIQDKGDLLWPYCDLSQGAQSGAIEDLQDFSTACYMGIPPNEGLGGITDPQQIDAMKGAMYAMVWDYYYRSDHLQDEIFQPLVQGQNDWVNDVYFSTPLKRNWNFDYFTGALPQASFGEDILLPLLDPNVEHPDTPQIFNLSATGGLPGATTGLDLNAGSGLVRGSDTSGLKLDESDFNLRADTVPQLRFRVKLQEFFEQMNRLGTKYRDMIMGRYGRDPLAGIVDEPVYIGGSKGRVTVSEVMQTAETWDSTGDQVINPVGNYSGQALALQSSKTLKYTCSEHGYIMCLVSVMPRTGYFQGIHRSWFRKNYLDYPWPEFDGVGDQAVMNKEIYWDWTDNNPIQDEAFGYTRRYDEWRWSNDTVAGKMRTDFRDWHMDRYFRDRPQLNSEFLECVPRSSDVFTMTSDEEHEIFAWIYHKNQAIRPISATGIPRI